MSNSVSEFRTIRANTYWRLMHDKRISRDDLIEELAALELHSPEWPRLKRLARATRQTLQAGDTPAATGSVAFIFGGPRNGFQVA